MLSQPGRVLQQLSLGISPGSIKAQPCSPETASEQLSQDVELAEC